MRYSFSLRKNSGLPRKHKKCLNQILGQKLQLKVLKNLQELLNDCFLG